MAKILIIDDSKIVLSMHTSMLEKAGHQCQGAINGYEALEKLMLENFDLIITDINMPRMDGYKLIRKIRELEQYQNTPVVIISTEEEAKDKTKGMEAGANVYIVKPTQPDDLSMNVEMLLMS